MRSDAELRQQACVKAAVAVKAFKAPVRGACYFTSLRARGQVSEEQFTREVEDRLFVQARIAGRLADLTKEGT